MLQYSWDNRPNRLWHQITQVPQPDKWALSPPPLQTKRLFLYPWWDPENIRLVGLYDGRFLQMQRSSLRLEWKNLQRRDWNDNLLKFMIAAHFPGAARSVCSPTIAQSLTFHSIPTQNSFIALLVIAARFFLSSSIPGYLLYPLSSKTSMTRSGSLDLSKKCWTSSLIYTLWL